MVRVNRGFSLFEIGIVLVISSILLSLSVSSYKIYITKAHRQEAETLLSQIALGLEQYYLTHHSYEHATLSKLHFPHLVGNGSYKIELMPDKQEYKILAIPQIQPDECGTLVLSDTNERQVTGEGSMSECW